MRMVRRRWVCSRSPSSFSRVYSGSVNPAAGHDIILMWIPMISGSPQPQGFHMFTLQALARIGY